MLGILFLNIILTSSFFSLDMTECFSFHSVTYEKFLWKKSSVFINLQILLLLMKWGCEYLSLSSLRNEDKWQKALVKYFRHLEKGAYQNGNYYRKSHNSSNCHCYSRKWWFILLSFSFVPVDENQLISFLVWLTVSPL